MKPLRVSRLSVYPVKSARGIGIDDWPLEPRGLRHDRRLMIVDAAGRAMTQRTHAELAKIAVALDDDAVVLQAEQHGALRVPLAPLGPSRRVSIWKDECDAVSAGREASAWLERVLGIACELVHMPDTTLRAVDPDYASAGDIVGFADAFPLLVTTEASLADLNARLAEPVGMDRFRPNVVIDGSEPFAEDDWHELEIGEVRIALVKKCGRCIVPTIDQRTAVRGEEPLATLRTFRTEGERVLFGQNAVPRRLGRMRRGDPVRVVR